MVSINPILLLVSTAAGQTKEEWAKEKIQDCKHLAAQGNYKESIRQAGLIMDQLYNGGDGSATDLSLLRSLKSAIKKHSEIAIATGKVYCPLPSTYLTFAITSLPQAIKESHDTTLQAKYILFTMAMIHAESRFNRTAINFVKHRDGSTPEADEIATGLGQLKPPTAREVLNLAPGASINLMDPATNIKACEAYIYRLFNAEQDNHHPGQLMSFETTVYTDADGIITSVIESYGGAEPNKVLNLFGIYKLLYLQQIKTQLVSQPFNQ
ncbi:MAG: lytic transglycosylase domain-containing protein [Candidatus Margulisiibacteriota bacterium]